MSRSWPSSRISRYSVTAPQSRHPFSVTMSPSASLFSVVESSLCEVRGISSLCWCRCPSCRPSAPAVGYKVEPGDTGLLPIIGGPAITKSQLAFSNCQYMPAALPGMNSGMEKARMTKTRYLLPGQLQGDLRMPSLDVEYHQPSSCPGERVDTLLFQGPKPTVRRRHDVLIHVPMPVPAVSVLCRLLPSHLECRHCPPGSGVDHPRLILLLTGFALPTIPLLELSPWHSPAPRSKPTFLSHTVKAFTVR